VRILAWLSFSYQTLKKGRGAGVDAKPPSAPGEEQGSEEGQGQASLGMGKRSRAQ